MKTLNPEGWEARKREILSAALRAFAARGLVGTRITDIAAEAGTSPALLYHYFPDKETVFAELVAEAFSSSVGTFEAACGLEASPAVKLWVLMDTIFHHAYQGDGPLYFLIMIQAGTTTLLPPSVGEQLNRQTRRYAELLLPVLVEGQSLGQVNPGNPRDQFHTIISLIQGFAVISGFRCWEALPPPTEMLVGGLLTTTGWEEVHRWRQNLHL